MEATAAMPDLDLDTLWRPTTQHALKKRPLVMTEGYGCMVVDADGKHYLDAFAGLWCVNLGYGQERLINAAVAQLRRLPFTALSRPPRLAAAPPARLGPQAAG